MPNYEYKFAQVKGGNSQTPGVFGAVTEGNSTTEVQAYTNRLGRQGWRVAAAVHSGKEAHYTLIFERPTTVSGSGTGGARKSAAKKSAATKRRITG